MRSWKILSLLALGAVSSPAIATVSFVQTVASAGTSGVVGPNGGSDIGPIATGSDLATGAYVASTADSYDQYRLAQVRSSAGVGVRVNSLTSADLFVRMSASADALAGMPASRAAASGFGFYDFAVDTASTMAINYAAIVSNASADTYAQLFIYSLDSRGLPAAFLRQGGITGQGVLDYDLAAGTYRVMLRSAAVGELPANLRGTDSSGVTFGLSLALDSPAAPTSPVPEPATWAMMLVGFGAIGTARRRAQRMAHKVA